MSMDHQDLLEPQLVEVFLFCNKEHVEYQVVGALIKRANEDILSNLYARLLIHLWSAVGAPAANYVMRFHGLIRKSHLRVILKLAPSKTIR